MLCTWQCHSPGQPPTNQAPAAASITSGTSIIRGRVTTTGNDPIGGVRVSIGPLSAQTSADGRYEITGLTAGSYLVLAAKDSFVPWRHGQGTLDEREPTMVTVVDHQAADDIDIALPAAAAVAGRVVEPGGRAVANARVMLAEPVFENGRRRLRPVWTQMVRRQAFTDNQGEFVLSDLWPGDYFLLAIPPVEAGRQSTLGPRPPGLAPTLYPAATGPRAASRIRLDFGTLRGGLDIILNTTARFDVRGVVLDRWGRPARDGRVQAMRRGDLPSMDFDDGLAGEATVQSDGSYALEGLRPGRYGLRALLPSTDADTVEERIRNRLETTAWSIVDVGERDLNGVDLRAAHLITVRGRVSFDDRSAAQSIAPADVCVQPAAWDPDDAWLGVGERVTSAGPGSAGRLAPGFVFEWRMRPGRLALNARLCDDNPFGTTPSWLIKRIVAGGRLFTDDAVDVDANGMDDIEIVLTVGPRLSGIVSDAKDTPQVNRVVIVFSQDRTHWERPRNRFFALGFTDGRGRYDVSVPPGSYHVAVAPHGSLDIWRDPEFLDPLVATAVRVSLAERDARTVNLVVTAQDSR